MYRSADTRESSLSVGTYLAMIHGYFRTLMPSVETNPTWNMIQQGNIRRSRIELMEVDPARIEQMPRRNLSPSFHAYCHQLEQETHRRRALTGRSAE
mgnify:CR=1 FL=1